jgi:hypothetical protein
VEGNLVVGENPQEHEERTEKARGETESAEGNAEGHPRSAPPSGGQKGQRKEKRGSSHSDEKRVKRPGGRATSGRRSHRVQNLQLLFDEPGPRDRVGELGR